MTRDSFKISETIIPRINYLNKKNLIYNHSSTLVKSLTKRSLRIDRYTTK